ncbi:MAG: glycogen/starch synthase [bacterium]|nr:glycogen/starch synthase [bacterium]
MNKKISVAFATAELTPIAKVGGLADVAGALPPVLKELGVDIRVILPKYSVIDDAKYPSKKIAEDILVEVNGRTEKISVFEMAIPNTKVTIYLIDNKDYLGENGIYFAPTAFADSLGEVHRFLFFSQAIVQLFRALDWYPDILHCQDWHVGILPGLLNLAEAEEPRLKKIASLFTIHNLANQGAWKKEDILSFLGLKESNLPSLSADPKNVNLIQQGILNADLINTVSRTYAKEILTPEYGEGLETELQGRRDDLSGIVNGIDQARFDPAKDPDIAVHFNLETIQDKKKNKAALQEACGLPVDGATPVFGIVSRLTDQKGIEHVAASAATIAKRGGQLILLGTGAKNFEEMMTEAQKQFPTSVSAHLKFDAALAQQIYAGSDFFLMPSRFEPCGLGQMIAMRYGTIPIVRATGGLKDTVTDASQSEGNGFVFEPYTSEALNEAINRAFDLYNDNPEAWLSLIKQAMIYDSSWSTAAEEYVRLYEKLLK